MKKSLSINVAMLGLVSLFTDVSSEMIYPLLPAFFGHLVSGQAIAVYIGLMDGLADCVSSFLKIYSGRLSDRLGKRKPLTVWGYGVSTLARPLMGLAFAGSQVVALRFFDRVGKGIRTSARDALISESAVPGARGLSFSFHRAMDHIGAVLGPIIAGCFLYAFLGQGLWQPNATEASPIEFKALRWLFAAAAIPGLAAMVVLIAKVKETSVAKPMQPDKVALQSDVRLPRQFYLYLTAVGVFTLGNSSDLFLIFYAQARFGLGLGQTLALWITLHVSKICFSIPGGVFSDRFGRSVSIVSGWTVYMMVYAAMAFAATLAWVWTLIAVYGLYYGLTEGAERALVADAVSCEHWGRAYGLYHGVVGLAALPASLVFGLFWARLGPRVAFMIGAGLAALAVVLLIFFLPRRTVDG